MVDTESSQGRRGPSRYSMLVLDSGLCRNDVLTVERVVIYAIVND